MLAITQAAGERLGCDAMQKQWLCPKHAASKLYLFAWSTKATVVAQTCRQWNWVGRLAVQNELSTADAHSQLPVAFNLAWPV